MEKNANYALVGLSSVVLFVGLLVFAFWLARFQLTRDFDVYDIVFQGPVRGISQGGEVHFNGIKVGEVERISLDPADPSRVIARARVTSDVPIRTDSYATLEPQGVTGVNYVQITAGTPANPLLKSVTERGQVPRIRSQRSALSDLLAGGGTVLTRTVEALDRVNRVLSDENIRTFSATVSDLQAFSAELRERKEIIADAQTALQNIDLAAQEFTKVAQSGQSLLDGEGKRTLTNLADAATEARAAAADLRSVVAKLEGPTSEFATNGLPQITDAVVSLQTSAASLERLASEIEANPRGLIGKPPATLKEVKP